MCSNWQHTERERERETDQISCLYIPPACCVVRGREDALYLLPAVGAVRHAEPAPAIQEEEEADE
jgi:hypothetical protein